MSVSDEVAQNCRRRIESLETWLRRLVHDQLAKAHGSNYLNALDSNGKNLIKTSIRKNIEATYNRNPEKYGRIADATLLDDSIGIICNPSLYNKYFKAALRTAFDDKGNLHSAELLRNFCERLIEPRNNLAHANPISQRQAEQVFCITSDIVESIKKYYRDNGMGQEFNSPIILSVTDNKGIKRYREKMGRTLGEGIALQLQNKAEYFLHPGDSISIAIDVDSAFDGQYKTIYSYPRGGGAIDFEKTFTVDITEEDIGVGYTINVYVVNINSEKKWSRMSGNREDSFWIKYKVLPGE